MTAMPANREPSMLDAALDLVRRMNWPVFPVHSMTSRRCTCGKADCASPTKHPRIKDWQKVATTHEGTITNWWSRWPTANIGIVTGAPSGLIVIDVDPRHGGNVSIENLEADHGKLPDTIEAITGSGGRHLLYRHQGGIVRNNANGKLGSGVDVRGDGGYIVASPSLHALGNRYHWELSSQPGDVPLADPPPWLLELIRERSADANASVAAPVDDRIGKGKRNDTLASLAGTLRRRGLDEQKILGTLREVNNRRCDSPLSDDEVTAIARSMGRYKPGADLSAEPRPSPPVEPWRPFPVEVLPEPVRSFVSAGAKAIGCDPSYIALTALVALASAIGNSRSIQLKRGWIEPAILWRGHRRGIGLSQEPRLSSGHAPDPQAPRRETSRAQEGDG